MSSSPQREHKAEVKTVKATVVNVVVDAEVAAGSAEVVVAVVEEEAEMGDHHTTSHLEAEVEAEGVVVEGEVHVVEGEEEAADLTPIPEAMVIHTDGRHLQIPMIDGPWTLMTVTHMPETPTQENVTHMPERETPMPGIHMHVTPMPGTLMHVIPMLETPTPGTPMPGTPMHGMPTLHPETERGTPTDGRHQSTTTEQLGEQHLHLRTHMKDEHYHHHQQKIHMMLFMIVRQQEEGLTRS